MKTLLWKDYRQNRQLLVAAGIFLPLPYAFALLVGGLEILTEGRLRAESWAWMVEKASVASLSIAVLLCAFVAGNAIAGERADRSAEFAAYLPISRRSAIASKAILAIGVCVLMLLVNGVIYCLAWWTQERPLQPEVFDVGLGFLVTAVFVFGVSWLFSSVLHSPAIAAALGIVSVIVVLMGLLIIEEIPGVNDGDIKGWYLPFFALLGPCCFVAGVLCYLRRIEP